MRKPAVSIVIMTARGPFPFTMPGLDCLDPVAMTLASQKARTGSFELIVVDALWDERGDWFAEHPQPYPVKHVPASPNYWHSKGQSGACSQLNRGIIWADGELVFTSSEATMFPPSFIHNLCRHYEEGFIPLAWYTKEYDLSHYPHMKHAVHRSPVPYDLCGYFGDHVDVDHRFSLLAGRNVIKSVWQHYFTPSSMPLEVAMAINGWNEMLDGEGHLTDCDVGSRIEMAGYGDRLSLHADLYVVIPCPVPGQWSQRVSRAAGHRKCNLALMHWHREHGVFFANASCSRDAADIRDECRQFCESRCSLRDKCQQREIGDPYPFIRPEYEHLVFPEWRDGLHPMLLEEERLKRARHEPPYDRGHFHGYA